MQELYTVEERLDRLEDGHAFMRKLLETLEKRIVYLERLLTEKGIARFEEV